MSMSRAISHLSSVSTSTLAKATGPIVEPCTVTCSASTTATPCRPTRSSVAPHDQDVAGAGSIVPTRGRISAVVEVHTVAPRLARLHVREGHPLYTLHGVAVLPLEPRLIASVGVLPPNGQVLHA